jgi:hypothetical protein
MVNQQIVGYISVNKARGAKEDEIRKALLDAGWSQQDIDDSYESVHKPTLPPPPKPPIYNNTSSASKVNMWDAFEHILLFISLYILSFSIGLILHQLVDQWAPNTLDYRNSYMEDWNATTMRIYLSGLIVSFPIFAYLFVDIAKRTKDRPELRTLHSRKVLIYLTLVVTFFFMLGSIIAIVYNFLSGNVTANFLLHFLVTVGVNGVIFAYYYQQIKEDRKLYG